MYCTYKIPIKVPLELNSILVFSYIYIQYMFIGQFTLCLLNKSPHNKVHPFCILHTMRRYVCVTRKNMFFRTLLTGKQQITWNNYLNIQIDGFPRYHLMTKCYRTSEALLIGVGDVIKVSLNRRYHQYFYTVLMIRVRITCMYQNLYWYICANRTYRDVCKIRKQEYFEKVVRC